jgi:predicted DNA binding CopG/RHH family protein
MKKRSANKRKKATKRTRRDQQLAEFEQRDLGDDIRASRSAVVLRGPSRPTSILLGPALIEKLRQKGAKRGLGYQTMLKMIVAEHVDEY